MAPFDFVHPFAAAHVLARIFLDYLGDNRVQAGRIGKIISEKASIGGGLLPRKREGLFGFDFVRQHLAKALRTREARCEDKQGNDEAQHRGSIGGPGTTFNL